jgi:hypothetical protein
MRYAFPLVVSEWRLRMTERALATRMRHKAWSACLRFREKRTRKAARQLSHKRFFVSTPPISPRRCRHSPEGASLEGG